MSARLTTRRQPVPEESLVLIYQVLKLTILGSKCVQLVVVEFTELFDVDWSALSVGFVVELGIVLVDLGSFMIVISVTKKLSAIIPVVDNLINFLPTFDTSKFTPHACPRPCSASFSISLHLLTWRQLRTDTHAAISSAPNSFLHFSLSAHINFAFGKSNFLARRNRSSVWSSNRSYLIRAVSSAWSAGMRPSARSSWRNWAKAAVWWSSLITISAQQRSGMKINLNLQVTRMSRKGIFSYSLYIYQLYACVRYMVAAWAEPLGGKQERTAIIWVCNFPEM